MSQETEEADLIVGAFYWAMPTLDPDNRECWEYFCQPMRFHGKNEDGNLMWHCIAFADPSDWPMRWIGPRIESPLGDEADRMALGNRAPE